MGVVHLFTRTYLAIVDWFGWIFIFILSLELCVFYSSLLCCDEFVFVSYCWALAALMNL